jgi:PAS domain-containing protein
VSKHSRWIMSKSLASLEVLALQKQINDLKEAAVAQRRLEMALRDAADFARAALDDSPIPLSKLTGDGKVVYANEAMVGFLGYASRKELLDLVPILGIVVDGQELMGLCQALPEPPAFVETIGVFRIKDGSNRTAHLRLRRGAQKSDFTLAIVNEAPRL